MGRICYSLKDVDAAYCHFLARTRPGAAVEVRLDGSGYTEEEMRNIFSCPRSSVLVATCHVSLPSQVEEAARMLTMAILFGTDYVDVPLDFPDNSRQWLMNLALNHGTRIILSYHNYNATDPLPRLLEIGRQARREGADLIKIVTTARSQEDVRTVLSLYEHFAPETLLAFAMGEEGTLSRFKALELGAPFLYVAPMREKATAAGQPCWFDLLPQSDILIRGEAALPASKSFAQRAILLAALATGTTKLYGLTLSDDVVAAIGVAQSLYAELSFDGTTLTIEGHQDIAREGLRVRDNVLFVGESGLLARLCIPLCGLSRETVHITGERTLLRRKVDEHRAALRKLGLRLSYTDRSYLPVSVGGKFHSGCVELDGGKGSQLISGLLLALSQCREESTVVVENVTSEPYIHLTTYIASFFGLTGIQCPDKKKDFMEDLEEDDYTRTWYVSPRQTVTPVLGLEVERDWSAAAMLLVAGAVAGEVTLRGLDLRSRQSDAEIYTLLRENHADIVHDPEKGTIHVRRSILTPFFFDITDAPDLFAPLFVLAAFTEGDSVLAGIGRLKNKESDRAATFAREFRKMGVVSHRDGDRMVVSGRSGQTLRAAACSSHGDHRLAMALMVASLRTDGPVTIDDTDCISKSFPDFPEVFDKLKLSF